MEPITQGYTGLCAYSITPEEYAWLLENRERMKSQQAWNVALAKHGHEGCNASNCEFCVEIEHNRLMREGEI